MSKSLARTAWPICLGSSLAASHAWTLARRIFSRRKFAVGFGNAVYIASGARPHRISCRNHLQDEVFQFSLGLIVGHQPNTHPRLAADDRSTLLRGRRQLDIRPS